MLFTATEIIIYVLISEIIIYDKFSDLNIVNQKSIARKNFNAATPISKIKTRNQNNQNKETEKDSVYLNCFIYSHEK